MKINKMYASTISLLIVLVVIAALILFKVKYYADGLDKMLGQIIVEIEKRTDNINVLNAELSYLTSPDRLERLTNKYLKMRPISAKNVKKKKVYTVVASK